MLSDQTHDYINCKPDTDRIGEAYGRLVVTGVEQTSLVAVVAHASHRGAVLGEPHHQRAVAHAAPKQPGRHVIQITLRFREQSMNVSIQISCMHQDKLLIHENNRNYHGV